jgi:hypothetical protein
MANRDCSADVARHLDPTSTTTKSVGSTSTAVDRCPNHPPVSVVARALSTADLTALVSRGTRIRPRQFARPSDDELRQQNRAGSRDCSCV